MHVRYVCNHIKIYQGITIYYVNMFFFAIPAEISVSFCAQQFWAPDSRAASQALMAWQNRVETGPQVTSCESHVSLMWLLHVLTSHCKHVNLETRLERIAVFWPTYCWNLLNLIKLVQLLLACCQIQSTPYEKPRPSKHQSIAQKQKTPTNQQSIKTQVDSE